MDYAILFISLIILLITILSISFFFNSSKINISPHYDKTVIINPKLDPILDPAYNMREVCKQSTLLEEHIMNPKKRCSDCITKHFMLITAYIEEGITLATDKVNRYPHIKESCKLYNDLFKEWLEIRKNGIDKNEDQLLTIADKLRKQRKILVAEYYHSDI